MRKFSTLLVLMLVAIVASQAALALETVTLDSPVNLTASTEPYVMFNVTPAGDDEPTVLCNLSILGGTVPNI